MCLKWGEMMKTASWEGRTRVAMQVETVQFYTSPQDGRSKQFADLNADSRQGHAMILIPANC